MKRRIRLTESDLNRIVMEAVKNVIAESNDPIYGKRMQNGKFMVVDANTGQPVANMQFDSVGVFMNGSLTAMQNGHTYEVYPNGQVQQARV